MTEGVATIRIWPMKPRTRRAAGKNGYDRTCGRPLFPKRPDFIAGFSPGKSHYPSASLADLESDATGARAQRATDLGGPFAKGCAFDHEYSSPKSAKFVT